ncbi:MAG: hypothetical protein JO100_05055 [Pseudonocardia sp.]|nr:hypothetical protein [Pseudonocardia sp.]
MRTARGDEDRQPVSEAGCISDVPRPRSPIADSLRRLLPQYLPAEPAADLDLDRVFADLTEIAVRTSSTGSWQEHACFLLGTADGEWHLVRFDDPAAAEVSARARTLPGFNTDLLLDVIGSRIARLLVLWTRSNVALRT